MFQGGGIKGVALLGAFAVLEERGYQPQRMAGNSAGAIMAALTAAGYGASDLYQILATLDFRRFEDAGLARSRRLKPAMNIFKNLGAYRGDLFHSWMAERLAAKGVYTFADLRYRDPDDGSPGGYRLQVIASNVTTRSVLILPQDAGVLGIQPDALEVALAVRMSMSLPLVFAPVRIRPANLDKDQLIVDGGLFSNFPIWLFDGPDRPRWPTFGLRLVEPEPRASLAARLPKHHELGWGIHEDLDFLLSVYHTLLEAHDRFMLEQADYERTIAISTLGVHTTEFDLPRERVLALYESGRSAAEAFLSSWDFDAYLSKFREK